MIVDGRYSRAVLSCIPLIVAVSYAIPSVLYLCPNDSAESREVNTERAIGHSKALLNLVNGMHIYYWPLPVDIGSFELDMFAMFTDSAVPEQDDSIDAWVSDNIRDIHDSIRMLAAALLLQVDSLVQRITAMEFTWQDIAWVRDSTWLPQTHNQACRTIVETRPAFRLLVDAARIYQQHKIVLQVAGSLVNGEANIDLINNGVFTCFGENVLGWAVGVLDHADAAVEMLVNVPGIIADLPMNHGPGLFTPLQQAATYGDARVVELLLGVPGIKVDAGAGTERGTALHMCLDRGTIYRLPPGPGACRVAELLIERGADVNALKMGGMTPLHLAARYPWPDHIITLLLENGAQVNAQDNNGRTALHYAEATGRRDCFELLLKIGKANPNLTDNEGETATLERVRSS
ncbi:Ankyrin repeat domain-containing protein [Plasmodiophora brassicae]|uniref:Uncharacterized protein n=1 Tax=Plasmodiophora brassicae TaxID=37360 RepID=A0A0G4J1V4_PLABS|nr:hypothetical protein PBRA_001867 [Plasmodiophora brassicae]